jgi:hypothetical protein
VDYVIILEVLALTTENEYLKQVVLRFTAENFRKSLGEYRVELNALTNIINPLLIKGLISLAELPPKNDRESFLSTESAYSYLIRIMK